MGLLADRKKLRSYLDQLADADWKKLKDRAARFAFWINAYNACCLEGVLQTLPADRARWGEYSVEDVSGFFGSRTYRVSGQLVTLDDIEHKTLRVQFADARLHFAIVCASVGCPLLRREAFVAGRLDQQLDEQARQFVGNPEKVRFDLEAREMKISKIFSWFEKDFLQESGSVARFLARYVSDGRLAESLRSQPWSIGYLDYDWDLNLKR